MNTPKATPPAEERFDDLLKRLEGLVARLEKGELPLEEALAAFEEGVGLVRRGQTRLDAMERRVDVILADGTTRPLAPSTTEDPDDNAG